MSPSPACSPALSVEKIASIDRGWLHNASNLLLLDVVLVEKIASIDRGWLLTDATTTSALFGSCGENSLD